MQVREERQLNEVGPEVLALTAVIRPILTGIVHALKDEAVADAGGRENLKLRQLPRVYRAGDGDCGICFEYAVHEALNRKESLVTERVYDAIRRCNVKGIETKSILFGLEKTGSQQLIDTAEDVLTDESTLLYGKRGRPAKLRKHLNTIAGAFRNKQTRLALPYSIRGLWKTDLFLGCTDADAWVATSVKINPDKLEGAAGLRIGIVPARQGARDRIEVDTTRNLVVCPLPYDGAFMQVFYEGWRIVQAFLEADAHAPKEIDLPRADHREVARILAERRDFPVLDVVRAIEKFGQPELLITSDRSVATSSLKGEVQTDTVVAPVSRSVLL